MTILNAIRLSAVLAASLLLNGCFVTTTRLPAGQGPVNDDALVGDWRVYDPDDHKDENVFIHIQKPAPDRPLRIVFVEDKEYHVYELVTTQTGSRRVFAAKVIEPQDAVAESHGASFLGYYEARGNELRFWLLDAEKVSDLIRAGKITGKPGAAKYDFAELNADPVTLGRFLASDAGWNARVSEPSLMHRITTPH